MYLHNPKSERPLKIVILCWQQSLMCCSCSGRDMLYQEVQGLSERMYILRLKVLKPNDLKTPPQKLINFLLRKNEKLLFNNPSMQIFIILTHFYKRCACKVEGKDSLSKLLTKMWKCKKQDCLEKVWIYFIYILMNKRIKSNSMQIRWKYKLVIRLKLNVEFINDMIKSKLKKP